MLFHDSILSVLGVVFVWYFFQYRFFLCGFHDFAVSFAPFFNVFFSVYCASGTGYMVRLSRFSVHLMPVFRYGFHRLQFICFASFRMTDYFALGEPGDGPGTPDDHDYSYGNFSLVCFFCLEIKREEIQACFSVLDVTRLPTVVSALCVHVYGWIV